MKRLIPPALRVQLKVLQRSLLDLSTGRWQKLVRKRAIAAPQPKLQPQITLTQPMGSLSGQHLANKKHNLALAIQALQDVVIAPKQIFSFWQLVGNPTTQAGYVQGRTITATGLAPTTGGGLCQISGLLYFLSLKSGLTIVERHPHSKDIYTDATRFTPLGSDATVVYGYKDLRIQNPFSFPICFRFDMADKEIHVSLCAGGAIAEVPVEFRTHAVDTGTQVETIRYPATAPKGEVMSSNLYPKLLVPAHLQ
jgi:vancomycin resistance protein VanW